MIQPADLFLFRPLTSGPMSRLQSSSTCRAHKLIKFDVSKIIWNSTSKIHFKKYVGTSKSSNDLFHFSFQLFFCVQLSEGAGPFVWSGPWTSRWPHCGAAALAAASKCAVGVKREAGIGSPQNSMVQTMFKRWSLYVFVAICCNDVDSLKFWWWSIKPTRHVE